MESQFLITQITPKSEKAKKKSPEIKYYQATYTQIIHFNVKKVLEISTVHRKTDKVPLRKYFMLCI